MKVEDLRHRLATMSGEAEVSIDVDGRFSTVDDVALTAREGREWVTLCVRTPEA
jgi:hypothetical protein